MTDIRALVPREFIVGVKINSGDYVDSATDVEAREDEEKRAMSIVRTLLSWSEIDFIEISGGDYENPSEPKHFERRNLLTSNLRVCVREK